MLNQDDLNRDLWLFHLAFRSLVRQPDETLAKHGLSRIHNRVLFVIARAGDICVGDIAQTLAISRQAIHTPMKQLRDKGLIASRPHPQNRTIQLIRLTARGVQFEYEINELQRQRLARAFAHLKPTGIQAWREAMLLLGDTPPSLFHTAN